SRPHGQGEPEASLAARGATAAVDTDGGAAHADMPGMIPADDLAAALRLEGSEVDARFVELMIDHHQGAVTAVNDALADGELSDPARDLAGRIATDQQQEITELEL